MPGVPSSRGCDACRKSKKKCDQKKPSCSRCTRLQLHCVGNGQRRFKFRHEGTAQVSNSSQATRTTTTITATTSRAASLIRAATVAVPRTPYSETLTTATAFVSILQVADTRYDLSCYGRFLHDLPMRLGTNPALDTAVDAITASFSAVYTRQPSQQAYYKYANALKSLRICLEQPIETQKAEILCAIYLLMHCQSWIGNRKDRNPRHAEVMAHILNSTVSEDWKTSFESEILLIATMPVLLESFVKPSLKLNPTFWHLKDTYGPPRSIKFCDNAPIESLKPSGLAKYPDYIRNPELHFLEIQSAYERLRIECPKLHKQLDGVADHISSFSSPSSVPRAVQTLQTGYRGAYSVMLSMALLLNNILRVFNPYDLILLQESEFYTDETMLLAEKAAASRPIGAGYIPMCLTAAWAATDDPTRRDRAEKLLVDYSNDLLGGCWLDVAIWLRNKVERLRLKLLTAEPIQLVDSC